MTVYIILSLLAAVVLWAELRWAIRERSRLRASRHISKGERLQAVAEGASGQLAVARAVAVFEDENKAQQWLAVFSPVLGARPMDLLGTTAGIAVVLEELDRIEVGDFA